MSCERFSGAITDHACGAAIGVEAGAHLDGCAACRRAFEMQRRVLADADALLERELSLTASPDFGARVAARVHGVERPPKFQKMAAASWVALAAAAAIILTLFIRHSVDPSRPDFRLKAEATKDRRAVADVRLKAETTRAMADVGLNAEAPRARTPGRPVASAFRRKSSAPPERSVEPPVIVERDRAAAIARLQELLANGALTDTMLPPARAADAAFAELTIAPMIIPDIVVPDVDNSGRGHTAPERQEKES